MSANRRDWNDLSMRFKSARKDQLFVHQSFAMRHYEGELGPGRITPENPPVRAELACPICGQVYPFSGFTEDHCPQKAEQSSYGGRYCVVLTCERCNRGPDDSYEGRAHQLSTGETKRRAGGIGFESQTESGLFVVRSIEDEAIALTDLKTAFLVAFAVLGYRFAFAPALRPVRAAIQAGSVPAVVAGMNDRTDDFPQFSVCEVEAGSGERITMVVGEEIMWNLPAGLEVPSGRPPGESQFRPYAWPPIEESGNRVAMQGFVSSGNLFHGDHCYKHQHHKFHGLAQPRSEWPVDAAHADPPRRIDL